MNSISFLPFEILENILLFAVTPVPTPVASTTLTGMPVPRWEQELKSGESALGKLLSPRLVSSRFCAASWKPFGKVLGETIFDIRSRDSLGHLVAVSSCKSLAPWVKKLTLGFYSAPKGLSGIHTKDDVARNLGSAGLEELQRVHAVERSWWPDVLRFQGDVSQDSEMASSPFESSGTEWYQDTMATCLKALRNLDDICYSFDLRILPARYRHVVQHMSAFHLQLSPRSSASIQCRARQGQDLLFQAMYMSGTSPRRLDIPALLEDEASSTVTPSDVCQKVCSRVTDLTIRSSEVVDLDQCIVIQHCGEALETLNLLINNDLSHSLSPDDEWLVHIPRLMKRIRPLNLGLLRIQLGTDASWAQTEYTKWHQSDLPELKSTSERWLNGVADSVQVQPRGFCAYLKRYGAWDGKGRDCDGEER